MIQNTTPAHNPTRYSNLHILTLPAMLERQPCKITTTRFDGLII